MHLHQFLLFLYLSNVYRQHVNAVKHLDHKAITPHL